ncbi:MAG TPA: stage III sporulation protein AC [Firmicutes bacterium]|nr:stage III sporulation protein AC [Bacillota bacterium]
MEIDIIFKIAAVGLLTAIVNQILKKSDKDEMATIVTLVGLVIGLLLVIDMLTDLFSALQSVFGLYT